MTLSRTFEDFSRTLLWQLCT